jgi:hypothetical protein
MRFRDTLKFALELFVPERLTHRCGSSAPDPKPEPSQNVATGLKVEEAVQVGKARRIIEELDYGQFGGPSFGPQTIELMSKALEGAEASLPGPASDQQLRLIAAKILKVAGDGERDPIRLKAAAMSALGSVAGNADEKPPVASPRR